MFSKLHTLLRAAVGDVNFKWSPPGWLRRLDHSATAWMLGHRRATALLGCAAIAATAGSEWTHQWYIHRPKPVTVAVSVTPPPIRSIDDLTSPPPSLIVKFESAARPLEVPRDQWIDAGDFAMARLEPAVEGRWFWSGDNHLQFQPKTEWPADRTYKVIFERKNFPFYVLLASYRFEMKTPAFVASQPRLEFYTDPRDPSVKQVVATLQFTHRVDPAEVAKHAQLGVLGESKILPDGDQPFTVTLGKDPRIAYLRTSPLKLPESEDFLRVKLDAGIATTQGGARTAESVEQKISVPDIYSYFEIKEVRGEIIRKADGEPEQVLMIKSRGATKIEELQHSLRVFLLPKKPHSDDAKKDAKETWESAAEIDDEVLSDAIELPLKPIPTDRDSAEMQAFKISHEGTGQLYVTIAKGAEALGGFKLGKEFASVLPVPAIPREITIEGEGGVLALGGERKLSIKSRGVKTIEYEIARVPADQINHLVSQTRGEFQNPSFVNYHFGRENIARIATEKQEIVVKNRFQVNYSAFDFSKHMRPPEDGGSPMQGLFFLKAREWKAPKTDSKAQAETDTANAKNPNAGDADNADDSSDSDDDNESNGEDSEEMSDEEHETTDGRFILVTDLGLIMKEDADGSRDVFIASIKNGNPLGGVTVEVLAKNGVPMLTGKTGADGRLVFAPLGEQTKEKRPVAIVARLGDDVAFMPYAREDRLLDFSRFDTEGVESRSGAELDASVFTERGIYRPGDLIHVGLIVKQRDWGGRLEGLPVEVEVTNARGESAQIRKLALPPKGFAETTYQTSYGSPSGEYNFSVYLLRNGKRGVLLGDTTAIVKEFQPDRMKIESRLTKESKHGWIAPEDVKAEITLKNLYGTPATNRRIKSNLGLSLGGFAFDEFAGYDFFDRLENQKRKAQTVDLGETTTNDDGAATVDLDLERFANATYALSFNVEGFEADSGRSVSTANHVLVSSQPYVIGVKGECDLSYIKAGAKIPIHWLAVDSTVQKRAVDGLECRLIEHTHISVLTQQDSGSYAYESVKRDKLIKTEEISISAEGLTYALPTDVPGEYALELFEKASETRVGRCEFQVVGRGNVTRSLERDAELQMKLSRKSYNSGEEIEIALVAPYTGSGLITIERDKVYAHAWFHADRTSSVQHIKVPEGFEGTGYVNVAFVRALDSKEVFMSPLSYAVAPFQANMEKRRLPITLRAPAKHRPGEPLRIGYKTDRPSRIAVFAVDEGILQVTNYELPDPLGHFFRKAALMVRTKQIVDLIMPEFSLLRQASAFGGDDEKRLNPFKRVTEKPVVYWSGILDAGPREQETVYEVPDYFSGTLRIMAVAVSDDAVGSTETKSLVRGPFVLTPNVPTVAAPGDRFEVSVSIANGVEGSGKDAKVKIDCVPSEHIEIIEVPSEPVAIAEGSERTATFTVRAKSKFGSASLLFRASLGAEKTQLRSTLSVRPAVPFMTTVRSGNFSGSSVDVKIDTKLHPDFRKQETTISALPLGLARGLDFYLKNYPNGCSEQITSGALARLMLADEADFGLTRGLVHAQLEHTFDVLRQRQNDQGRFGYWAAEKGESNDFVSVYVMQMLIEAKAAGFPPPAGMLATGLRHLQQMAGSDPQSLQEARTISYAIYVLTREGIVTTNYILNLRDSLDKRFAKQWQSDLIGVYLAGSYALLQKSDEAQKLIAKFEFGKSHPNERWDFYSDLGADAQYLAILGRHFPDRMRKITPEQFQPILSPIGRGQFNTLSAAYSVLALKSLSLAVTQSPPTLGIVERLAGGASSPLKLTGSALLKRGPFSAGAESLRFTATGDGGKHSAYYQTMSAGYDLDPPTTVIADGLDIERRLLGPDGLPAGTVRLGDPLTVELTVRSYGSRGVTNVAVVDLLPGGFELVADSVTPGARSGGWDFVEVREDRLVLFGNITWRSLGFRYKIKPTVRGRFQVPPEFAESMYEPSIKARGLPSVINVIDAK